MKKTSLAFLLISFFLLSCGNSQKSNNEAIPFTYNKEDLKNNAVTMYVPVKLKGIDKTFKMQFDLGLNVSVIYENCLKTILNKYPNLKTDIGKIGKYNFLKHSYQLANYKSDIDTLIVYKNYGSDADFNKLSIIGTIGVNEVKNKILIINFKDKKMRIKNQMNEDIKTKFSFIDMRVENNKILINLKVDDKIQPFLFDTGTGIGIVTTNRKFYLSTTDNAEELRDTIQANSWGKKLEIPGAKFQDIIFIGNSPLVLDKERVYLSNNKKISELLNKYDVEHIIGPKSFLNEIIVLDFIHHKFGIKK